MVKGIIFTSDLSEMTIILENELDVECEHIKSGTSLGLAVYPKGITIEEKILRKCLALARKRGLTAYAHPMTKGIAVIIAEDEMCHHIPITVSEKLKSFGVKDENFVGDLEQDILYNETCLMGKCKCSDMPRKQTETGRYIRDNRMEIDTICTCGQIHVYYVDKKGTARIYL